MRKIKENRMRSPIQSIIAVIGASLNGAPDCGWRRGLRRLPMRWFDGAAALAVAAALFAASAAPAQRQRAVNVYNWSDYIAPGVLDAFTIGAESKAEQEDLIRRIAAT